MRALYSYYDSSIVNVCQAVLHLGGILLHLSLGHSMDLIVGGRGCTWHRVERFWRIRLPFFALYPFPHVAHACCVSVELFFVSRGGILSSISARISCSLRVQVSLCQVPSHTFCGVVGCY